MSSEKAFQGGEKGGKIVVIIATVLTVIIFALVGVIVYLFSVRDKEGAPVAEEERRNVVVTAGNIEKVVEQMESAEVVPPGYYTVTMTNVWHFPDGNSTSYDAYVENKLENTNDVYLDVFLATDEENAIYKSPVIPLGNSLEEVALDTPLDAGTYDCIAIYHLVDEEQHTVSTLRVAITVVIEK